MGKLQALVYDIPLWRKVPESDARNVGQGSMGQGQASSTEWCPLTNMAAYSNFRSSSQIESERDELREARRIVLEKVSEIVMLTI